MFTPRVKIPRNLYEDSKEVAAQQGYSSVDEFVRHVLEKTIVAHRVASAEEHVRKRLKGLGYVE